MGVSDDIMNAMLDEMDNMSEDQIKQLMKDSELYPKGEEERRLFDEELKKARE